MEWILCLFYFNATSMLKDFSLLSLNSSYYLRLWSVGGNRFFFAFCDYCLKP